MNKSKIISEAEKIYNKKGQSAVFDFANKHNVKYEYCSPCETSSPQIDHECLVCGSPTVEQLNIKIIDNGMIFVPASLKDELVDNDLIHFDGIEWLCFEGNVSLIEELIYKH